MKQALHKFTNGLFIAALLLLLSGLQQAVLAQTTITTTFTNNNGSGLATFNFKNNGTGPVQITEIGSVCGSSSTQTVSAWYKPTPISGPPGAITTGNGWTQFGSGTIMGISNTTTSIAQIFFPTSSSTLTPLVIPPGETYGMVVSANSLRYSTLTPGVYTETAGSCSIITGDLVGYGGAVPPAAPTNYPRGFIGYVKFIELTPCTGTPTATLASTVTSACAGVPFTLNATPTGAGLTYQYQFSTDGGTIWNNLAPASSSSSYIIPSQTVATSYRVIVTCDVGGTDTSAAVAVGQNPVSSCFCTPTTSGGTTYYINNFTTTGGLLNITKTSGSSAGYQDFHTTDTLKANPGNTINYSIGVSSGTFGRAIWIDYNENGTFEPTEQVASSTSYLGSPLTGTFTIPFGTTVGMKRMRVLASSTPSNPSNPCTNSGSGEYEDYTVQIIALTPCTGVPAAVIASTVTNVCAGTPFNLSATPIGMSGLTYQFQVSTDGGTVWTNIGTAGTSPNYTIPTQTVASSYRVIVTCAGGGTDTSASVAVAQNAPSTCFCTPTTGGGTTYYINNFTTTGGLLNIAKTSGGSAGYQDFHTTDTLKANPGNTINYSIGVSTGSFGRAIWIDYNENGVFEPTEQVASSTTYVSSFLTGSFTIPFGTTAGSKRMRILAAFTPSNPSNPCVNSGSGEYEDYTVQVIALTPCAGVPAATIASTVTNICAGVPFNLSATPIGMSGLTYQFQVSTDGGTVWTNIGTAGTSPSYTIPSQTVASSYRVIVTCAGGSADTSAAVAVAQNLPSTCYCTPSTGGGSTYYISNFTTTGALVNINKNSAGSTTGYQDFHTTDSMKANPGTTINYSISVSSGTYGRAIWIDYNENGVFESTEKVASSTTYESSPLIGTFTIPFGTSPGNKRLRVIASWTPSDPNDPCINSGSGEYEDYTVQILSLTTCSGTPAAVIASTVTNACAGVPFTLSATPVGAGGLTYQFQVSTDGGTVWTSLAPPSTAPSFIIPSQTVTSQYRVIVTCALGGSDTSATVTVVQNLPSTCYCTPSTISSSYYIDNFSTTGGILNISNLGSGYSTAGYGNFTSMSVGQVPGGSISYSLNFGSSTGYTFGIKIWVDWNQNGSFTDPGEQVYVSPGYASTYAGTIAVPLTATPGPTRMRIGANYLSGSGPATPCETFSSGEYEDYTFNVINLTPCSGTPGGGTTSVAADTLCPGGTTVLTLSGYDVTLSGLSFQWEQSTSPTGPFTSVTGGSGATSLSYTTPALSDSMYYRVKVTCINSGLSGYSTISLVNVPDTAILSIAPGGSCVAAPVTLSATSAPGTTIRWWASPTGGTPLATGPSYTTPIISVTTTYYVSARSISGCEGPRVPVQALIGAFPTITAEPASDTVCAGQSVTLSVTATSAATYQWYGPSGLIPGANSPSYTIPAAAAANAGEYIVEALGAPGCGSTLSEVAHLVVGQNGTWRGYTSDWNTTSNWCGGLPTATTDVLIPDPTMVTFSPVVATSASAQARSITIDNNSVTVNGTMSVYGDIVSLSGATFDAPGGTILLPGTSTQNIGPSFTAATLAIEGGGQKNLVNDVQVTNILNLNNGIVNLQNATMTLSPGAAIIGGTASSYVRTNNNIMGGLKQEVGSTPVRFPVGKSAFNPATISNSGTAQNTLVRVRDEVLETGYTGAPLNASAATFVINRTWDIESDGIGTTNATLKLQWNAGEQNSSAFDYSHVFIAHYVGGEWENTCCSLASMAPPAVGSGPYTVTQSGITHFSPFTVASAGGDPLQVSSATQADFAIEAYPNPATDLLTVKVTGGLEQAQISLIDMTGRELMARFAENGKAVFELKALPAGVYLIRYQDGKYLQTLKINKQ